MNSLDRITLSLNHKEPDRVPFLNSFTIQGAAILGLSYEEYYSNPENIALAQELLRDKFGHDCLLSYYYAAVEVEAFGGDHVFNPHGPPQAGTPPFSDIEIFLSTELPDPHEKLKDTLKATELLAYKWGTEVPVINGLIAPLSLAVLLFGMEPWMDLIVISPKKAREVVRYLLSYSINYANACFENGATAVGYANPLAAPSMLRQQEYQNISLEADQQFFAQIKGPATFSFAGCPIEPLIPLIVDSGAAAITISAADDLGRIKQEWGSKLVLVGNLNNIAMETWTPAMTDTMVHSCYDAAALGGGFVLSDHQGDLPEGVSDAVLYQIRDSVKKWGNYEKE